MEEEKKDTLSFEYHALLGGVQSQFNRLDIFPTLIPKYGSGYKVNLTQSSSRLIVLGFHIF